MNIIKSIEVIISGLLNDIGIFAPILSCLLISIESIFPILPLALFITINSYYLGNIIGFIISYTFTCIGCYISYSLCKNKLKKHYDNMLNKLEKDKLKKFMNKVSKLKLEELTLLIAIPFTPAFLINITAGLSNINRKKYIISLLIGKIFLVLFWQYIGTNLIESLQKPLVLIKIIILMIIAFIISKLVNKRFRLE